MLSRSAALALGATTALVAAQRCLDKYQCMFHHDYNGVEYSWDLHTLCKDGPYLTEPASAVGTPATDYVWTNQAGQNFTFNICGNASAVCAWDPVQAEYNSRGVVVQVCVLGGSRPVRTLSTPGTRGPRRRVGAGGRCLRPRAAAGGGAQCARGWLGTLWPHDTPPPASVVGDPSPPLPLAAALRRGPAARGPVPRLGQLRLLLQCVAC
jgi:hypothetical protein